MKEKTEVSILIPVYNGNRFLNKTIESIQNQTFTNFEVVFVDDGSTDGSVDVLNSIAEKDKRFRIIKNPIHLGDGSKSTAYGLQFCEGNYFLYMSQDDFLSSDCLEKCFNQIKQNDADICIPDCVFFFDDEKKDFVLTAPNKNYSLVMTGEEAFYKSIIYKLHGFSLRNMSLVKKVGFEGEYFDSSDKSASFQYFFANKIVFCDSLFFYRQNNENAITKVFSKNTLHHLDTCNEVLDFSFRNRVAETYIREMLDTFIQRRKGFKFKVLRLEKKDRLSCEVMLRQSLFDLRKCLFKNFWFRYFLRTFIEEKRKEFIKYYIYNFFLDLGFENNFLVKKIERTLYLG